MLRMACTVTYPLKVNSLAIFSIFHANAVSLVFPRQGHWGLCLSSCKTKPSNQAFWKYYCCLVSLVFYPLILVHNSLLFTLHYCLPSCWNLNFANIMPIAKCLATLQPYKETYCSSLIESLKSPLSNDITCTFKFFWKESALSEGIVVVWHTKPKKQFVDAKNSWFRYLEIKMRNSFSRIQNVVATSFLRIFKNLFTRTLFLFA